MASRVGRLVCDQEFENGVLKQTRVNFLGARGIEAIITVDHTRNDQASLQWLFYDGHGNVVRVMFPHPLPLSRSFGRGVWRSRRGEGSCANLGHPEDERGLVYMRARYYEPWTGRFISEDPSRDGVNWYLYADGNPVGKVDVEGKEPDFSWYVFMAVMWYALVPVPHVNNPFLNKALDVFIGMPAGQPWYDRLNEAVDPYRAYTASNYLSLLSIILSLLKIQLPVLSYGTMAVSVALAWALPHYIALVAVDIAFEEGR